MGSRDRLEELDGVRAEPRLAGGRAASEALGPVGGRDRLGKGKTPDSAGVRREAADWSTSWAGTSVLS